MTQALPPEPKILAEGAPAPAAEPVLAEQVVPEPEAEPLYWQARQNLWLLWLICCLVFAASTLSFGPLWALITGDTSCGVHCEANGAGLFFAALGLVMALLSLPLLILIPLGGYSAEFRLYRDRFEAQSRILSRHKTKVFALPGHIFSRGRLNTVDIHAEVPGRGRLLMMSCLSRAKIDALRDALPQGAWR